MLHNQVAEMNVIYLIIAAIANVLPNACFKSLRIRYSNSNFWANLLILSYSISNHAATPIASWK